MNNSGQITIIRKHPTIAVSIDAQGYAWCLQTGRKFQRRCYDGRMVYLFQNKQLGYATFKRQPKVNIIPDISTPF